VQLSAAEARNDDRSDVSLAEFYPVTASRWMLEKTRALTEYFMIGLKGALALAAVIALNAPVGAQMTNSAMSNNMSPSATEMHKTMTKSHTMTSHRMSHSTMMMSMKSCHRLSHAKMMRNKQCRMMMRHHHRMMNHKM
jgi:hypothetical protein